jgi:sugar/nucleoside kinase (ribokinase family)
MRRMKEKGIATSMDMTNVDPNSEAGGLNWVTILGNVLPYTDFFVPSFEELCFMLNRQRYEQLSVGGDMTENLDMLKDVKPLAEKCLELGCRAVLIKCGISGMYYKTAGREVVAGIGSNLELDSDLWADREGVQPCFKADQVLSGTGAGDTSIAAFLMAASMGRNPEQRAALAAAEGACAVTAYDALSGLKTMEELEARIASGWETMGG